jgi:hypothetical protein
LRASFTNLNLKPIDASLLQLGLYSPLDMRVSKTMAIGNQHLELLLEGFNLLNHSNLRQPFGSPPNAGSNINSAAFLQADGRAGRAPASMGRAVRVLGWRLAATLVCEADEGRGTSLNTETRIGF